MASRIRRLAILLCVMWITVSCSSDSGGGLNGGANNSNGGADDLGIIVDPIKVTLTLDESSAASATVGPQGGTVSVTSQDGTTYTLVIPAGALISAEEISLTPVTGMDGLPLSGGLVGAVDFSPDGLELSAPAILTIQAPNPIEGGEFETVGLAYIGDGEELYLYPMTVAGDTITMEVYHFSGNGAGQGTSDEVEDMADNHAPSDPNAQTENAAGKKRPQVAALVYASAAWTVTVEPLLKQALADETKLNQAYITFMGWLRFLDQYELRDGLYPEANKLVDYGYELLGMGVLTAGEKAHSRCVAKNDPSEVVNLFHWIAFAERDERIAKNAYLDVLDDLAFKCATFELEFVSEVRADPGAAEMYFRVSTGKIKIVANFEIAARGSPASSVVSFSEAEGKLTYNDQYHPGEEFLCPGSSITLLDSTFTIEELSFDLAAPAGSATIEFRYDPGTPSEKWVMTPCIGNDPPAKGVYHMWMDFFCDMRVFNNEIDPVPPGCFYEDAPFEIHAFVSGAWEVSGTGKIYAVRFYERSIWGGVISEVTSITIYHAPQK